MSKILAIESAVAAGSLCILDEDGRPLAESEGNSDVARAEDLLLNIDGLISAARIRLEDISLIAVSNGPGSYTGIRIGIATALGLARAVGTDCTGVDLLKAIAASAQFNGAAVVAVPFGKHGIAWQAFAREGSFCPTGEVRSGQVEEIVDAFPKASIVVPPQLRDSFFGTGDEHLSLTTANLARLIGQFALNSHERFPPKAIYVRATDNRIARIE